MRASHEFVKLSTVQSLSSGMGSGDDEHGGKVPIHRRRCALHIVQRGWVWYDIPPSGYSEVCFSLRMRCEISKLSPCTKLLATVVTSFPLPSIPLDSFAISFCNRHPRSVTVLGSSKLAHSATWIPKLSNCLSSLFGCSSLSNETAWP